MSPIGCATRVCIARGPLYQLLALGRRQTVGLGCAPRDAFTKRPAFWPTVFEGMGKGAFIIGWLVRIHVRAPVEEPHGRSCQQRRHTFYRSEGTMVAASNCGIITLRQAKLYLK